MSTEEITARRVRFEGSVQGIGFRAYAIQVARQLRLTGWVRNRADGSVETLVCGTTKAIEDFVSAGIKGPPGARVSAFEVFDAEVPADAAGFVQRPTL
jgi:acylphosphatase